MPSTSLNPTLGPSPQRSVDSISSWSSPSAEEPEATPPKSPPLMRYREYSPDDPELYEKIAQAIRRSCPVWMNHRRDDLTQLAVLKILERWQRADQKISFCASYLFRTAHAVVIDAIRKHRRKDAHTIMDSQHEHSLIDQSSTKPNDDPEAEQHRQDLRSAIFDCLGKMKTERRLALSLNLQGFSNREAAQMLGWGEKRNENLTSRGRMDLRKCLTKKGIDYGCKAKS